MEGRQLPRLRNILRQKQGIHGFYHTVQSRKYAPFLVLVKWEEANLQDCDNWVTNIADQ